MGDSARETGGGTRVVRDSPVPAAELGTLDRACHRPVTGPEEGLLRATASSVPAIPAAPGTLGAPTAQTAADGGV